MGTVAVIIALAAVAVILGMGLVNMMRGGSPQRSQNLMRWRVTLQFLAIIVIIIVVWATRPG
jgi:ABC-type Na+ efflux pump permease subunit